MEDKEIKEAVCEIYESLKQGSSTPRLIEIVGEYRNWLEIEADMKREASN